MYVSFFIQLSAIEYNHLCNLAVSILTELGKHLSARTAPSRVSTAEHEAKKGRNIVRPSADHSQTIWLDQYVLSNSASTVCS